MGVTAVFAFVPSAAGTELRLMAGDRALPVERWPIEAPAGLLAAVDLIRGMVADEKGVEGDDVVLVEHAAIAELSAHQATLIGFPPLADARAQVSTTGLVTGGSFKATLQWVRPTGQAVVGAVRTGAWLRIGGRDWRLSAMLLALAEAVEEVAAALTPDARLRAIAALRDALPGSQPTGAVLASGLMRIDVVQADAFSLDLRGEGPDARLVPILHRAGSEEHLLSETLQDEFGIDQFNRFTEARPVYSLSGGVFVVLAPVLREALGEVRRHQYAPLAEKRALLRSPRRALRATLDADDDPTLLDAVEQVFVETRAYSDRVTGLGLWEPRALPWVARAPTDWFAAANTPPRPGERAVTLNAAAVESLRVELTAAIADGSPTIEYRPPGGVLDASPVVMPATQAQLERLDAVAAGTGGGTSKTALQVLLILTNEGTVDYETSFTRRADVPAILPVSLTTSLKPHQAEGLRWLQESWLAGAPGVLLADDMGLGKTLQGLAFLAWLREAMQRGAIPQSPILIVAPTGLLANWSAEHARHLYAQGLGECCPAFGAGLRALRQAGGYGLDKARLESAAWILTTYETLRDHSADFGGVAFAALLADEAQKVKTPGVRITDALKGMNADFRIAMTGTPVENRLADLWCIVDGVRSGYLDSLEAFSHSFEAQADHGTLRGLRRRLDERMGGMPALMLRRMREDHLPELPGAEMDVRRSPMPAVQFEAYRTTLERAREVGGGGVLQVLQSFRTISLHPDPAMEAPDDAFIRASARLSSCFDMLDRIAAAGERALIFVESRALQPRLAGMIQRRYRLAATPEIISGAVPGAKRQARVDRFQMASEGFDGMIISPRAGGVGLTLTRANHVIHLDRWWNPAVEDQCTARALRIGQRRTVHIHIPLATLPDGRRSFDENLDELLTRKRRLTRDVLLPPEPDSFEAAELLGRTVMAG